MSKRIDQLSKEISKHLANWLREDFPDSIISIVDLVLSDDMYRATVWLSISGPASFNKIRSNSKHYRHMLAEVLKTRIVPELDFQLANDRITNLIDSLN